MKDVKPVRFDICKRTSLGHLPWCPWQVDNDAKKPILRECTCQPKKVKKHQAEWRKLPKSQECGPWRARTYDDRRDVYVESNDFTHDALLIVRGDFKDHAEKLRYARMIARRLNKATKLEKGRV
jgi:hypothetical protein